MKKLIIILIVLFTTTISFAQQKTKNPASYSIKLYNLSVWDKSTFANPSRTHSRYPYTFSNRENTSFLHPSFALQWSRKKIQEIELSFLEINKRNTSKTTVYDSMNNVVLIAYNVQNNTNITVRYEYIWQFLKNTHTINPSIGFAASPYYQRERIIAYSSNVFSEQMTAVGVRMFVTPRAQWNITRRSFMDVNVPICISDFRATMYKIDNPLLARDERNYAVSDFNTLPKYYSFRIGVGIKL